MNFSNYKHSIFRILLHVTSAYIFVSAFLRFDFFPNKDADIIFLITFVSFIIMGMMEINAGKGYVQLTDALVGLLFIKFGRDIAVIFYPLCWIVTALIGEKILMKQMYKSRKLFNAAMFVIVTYISSTLANQINSFFPKHNLVSIIISSFLFIGFLLITNIGIIKIDYRLESGNNFKLSKESKELLSLNFVVSTMLTTTLCLIYEVAGILGTILVIGNLIILHYCFYIYRKLEIRNEAIKGLLKITNDIVKYGDFRDKCKHLIISLKELIPYNICAVYTFDVKQDIIVYPIAYNSRDELDIGELGFDFSPDSITSRIVKEGKIYISKDIKKDKRIRIVGKLAETSDVIVFVPIVIEDKVSGLLLLGGKHDLNEFMNNGISEILNILSNQMALAIENDSFYRSIINKADRDSLTKLFNRRVFEREIKNLIDNNIPFSMVMYDVDDFKRVNDGYGHLTGDKVLMMLSDIIIKSIRKTDVPCRYGGEEIAIIFKDLSKEDAYIISERIREKIEKTATSTSCGDIFVTISGGVASYPEDGENYEEIIGRADSVLYRECKNKGKNRVCVFSTRVSMNDFNKDVPFL